MTSKKHKELQDVGIYWLHKIGCSIFAKEVPTSNGIADCLGVRTRDDKHTVYYIEAKQSRSDLVCDKQKKCYQKSIGGIKERCYYHSLRDKMSHLRDKDLFEECDRCREIEQANGDTCVDFYYLIVADNVKVEDSLYEGWGVLNEKGVVIRKAKRMKREKDTQKMIVNIAHVLVYKVFGKLYL